MLEPKRRHGSRNWYIRGTVIIWENGKPRPVPIDQSARTTDYGEACAIAEQISAQVKRQNITGEKPMPYFGQWVEEYIQDGGEIRFLEKVLDFYEFTPADKVTDDVILRDGNLAYPGRAAATIRRQWDTPIRAVIRHNTQPRRRKVTDNQRTHFFRPQAIEKIIRSYSTGRYATDLWGPALITFLVGQGARVGEALAIDAQNDVFLDQGLVLLRNTKNGHERRLTLIPRVTAALSVLPNLNEPGPLFRRWDGKPFAEKINRGGQIRTRFQRCVKQVGLDPKIYTPHVCRHTWATWFYSQTKDEKRLRDEGGWRSDQYQRYVQLSSPKLGEEARNMNWAFDGEAAIEGTAARGLTA